MGGYNYSSASARYNYDYEYQLAGGDRHAWKGPRKVFCFCCLSIVFPALLISIPLTTRFVMYGNAKYVFAPSDMRIVDDKISTIWCQGETVRLNTTFTAYRTQGMPELDKSPNPLTIERTMLVPDDRKEYWGFYLLKGSTFRVFSCARFKGGTLLVVEGRSHLEYCAYIGESDSAGNSDEFSSSGSQEKKVTDGKKPETSAEQMSLILQKIREYVKSNPKHHRDLKNNLVDWMLLPKNKEEQNFNKSAGVTRKQLDEHEVKITVDRLWESVTKTESNDYRDTTEEPNNDSHQTQENLPDLTEKSTEIQHGMFRSRRSVEVTEDANRQYSTTSTRRPRTILEQQHFRGVLNETYSNQDGSDSESESSFSSSEEAMLKCEGVLSLINVLPDENCSADCDHSMCHDWYSSSLTPLLEGQVNKSGYYYFIFGSENEKRTNFIRALFELEKYEYDLPEPIEGCTDARECHVDFNLASSEKVVIQIPQPPRTQVSLWDEIYVGESECTPRTALYLVFMLLVPLVILLCAFQ